MNRLPDLSEASDRELVGWAREGDENAFREMLRRHGPSVFDLIYRLVGHHELAEDLTQETFDKAFRALDSQGPEHKVSAWILRIANNTAIDYIRRKRPDSIHSALATTPGQIDASGMHQPTPSLTPTPSTDPHEFAAALERAVRLLRPEYRRCFVLRYLEERSYDDIADTMNVPKGTVGTYLHRTRAELRRMLEPTDGFGGSATPH